jgi:ribonuclease VapC
VILDSSAIVAILKRETESDRCLEALLRAEVVRLSTANLVEVYLVMDRSDASGPDHTVQQFLSDFAVDLVAVSVEHARLARDAHRRFGRGNHPAKLNFGDCFAYALARATGEPLLFVGNDFSRTDIAVA